MRKRSTRCWKVVRDLAPHGWHDASHPHLPWPGGNAKEARAAERTVVQAQRDRKRAKEEANFQAFQDMLAEGHRVRLPRGLAMLFRAHM